MKRKSFSDMNMKCHIAELRGCLIFCLLIMFVHCYKRIDVRERAKQISGDRNFMHKRISKRSLTETDGAISVADLLNLQAGEELKTENTLATSQGFIITKFQEFYMTIPVFDGSLTIEVTENGTITGGATGTLIQDIKKDIPDVRPTVSKEKALEIAISSEGDDDRKKEIGDINVKLWIYPWKDKARLVYTVKYLLESMPPKRPSLIIDAFSGDILMKYNDLNGIDDCSSKSIHGYGGNEKYGKIEYGKVPYCIEPKEECLLENKYVRVVSMNHSYTETESSQDTVNYPCDTVLERYEKGAYSPVLDAFFFGTVVSRMYEDWIGGFPLHMTGQIVLRVHYGIDFDGAFWNGRNCTFGDGNTSFFPLTSLDVIGHEIGHGVVHQNSGLGFVREAKALNEGFADILGLTAMMYFYNTSDWSIGWQITKTTPFHRSFEDPETDGSFSHVDNITSNLHLQNHQLAGPIRLAFYNIVTKYNISVKNAFRSFDRANKLYWPRGSSFQEAGCGVIKAAYDLGQNVASYEKSFDAVGIVNCSVFDSLPHLKFNHWYKGIVVSNDSQPIFKFQTMPLNGSISILAFSNNTKIEIRVDNDKEAAMSMSFNMFSGINKITFVVSEEIDWYVGLFPLSGSSENVSLMISFTCNSAMEAFMRASNECLYYMICDTESYKQICFL